MAVYKTDALILRRIPLGETDKIVTLYTRDMGKFNAVAKGARKTTSRLAGAAEPLMFLNAALAEGMNLDVLTQCEVRDSFPGIRSDYGLYLRATFACELVDKLSVERNAAPDVFNLLLSTLKLLPHADDPDAVTHAFELQLMAIEGYEPFLSHCIRCERLLERDLPPSAYSPSRGGALCVVCEEQAQEEILPMSPFTWRHMIRLLEVSDTDVLARTRLTDPVREEMARILRAHWRYRMERDVRSTAFLDAFRLDSLGETGDFRDTMKPQAPEEP